MELVLLIVAVAIFPVSYFVLRRRARLLREKQTERPTASVNPLDGTIEPMPKLGSRVTHDPSVTGIFDRSGVARQD
jgi:hypothetical protein